MINQNTENAAIQLVDHLESYSDISDCEDALSDFSKSANATFWIEDENGNIVFPSGTATETETVDRDTAITYDENVRILMPSHLVKRQQIFIPLLW